MMSWSRCCQALNDFCFSFSCRDSSNFQYQSGFFLMANRSLRFSIQLLTLWNGLAMVAARGFTKSPKLRVRSQVLQGCEGCLLIFLQSSMEQSQTQDDYSSCWQMAWLWLQRKRQTRLRWFWHYIELWCDSIYNFKMHQRTLVLVILALCLTLAECSIANIPFQSKNVNYTHLLCLKALGKLDDFFITGQLESTQTFKFFISSVDFDELQQRSLMPHFNISLVDLIFYFSPEVTASYYVATLEKYYVGMLWFEVALAREEDVTCGQMLTMIKTIEYISKRRIGIIGNKEDWVWKFGSEQACSQFSAYPLFYSGLEPFEPFAGWQGYQYSKGQSFNNVCGISYEETIAMTMLTSE